MTEPRKPRWITLNLGFFESQILLQSLRAILRNYQVRPEETDPGTAAVWYSTRGCESAGMSPEEIVEWRRSLFEMKRSNVESMQRWIRALSRKKEGPCRIRINLDEVPSFLTVLNDHRLWLAAQNNIGQEEMDLRLLERLKNLPPRQQTALLEMELMGAVMEDVMRKLDMGYSG